jgi:hypothetical protein
VPQPSFPPAHPRVSQFQIALLIGILLATAYTFWPRRDPFPFFFEIAMGSAHPGVAQLYYDVGNGINEHDSSRLPVQGGASEITYRFPLPQGNYTNLRFDPTDRPGNTMTLSGARIVDRAGRLLRSIPPGQIKPIQQIDKFETSETALTLTTAANGNAPTLAVEPSEPIALKSFGRASFRKLARRFLLSFLVAGVIAGAAARFLVPRVAPKASSWARQVVAWGTKHPRQLVVATATASVVLSCYPVVFFGKSFVSPNNHSHTFLLYGEMPTVPGYKDAETDDEKGSDLGAVMWYSWPTSVVESRALFRDFELPLWNRFDSAGLPLLGQGQSMFGDPLHFLVLLGRGHAGWWDLKYLLAKFLFAAALGVCVLRLTRHVPAAVIVAVTAPFIGFYSYRYSHPAFFSISYAPLIFLGWLKLIDRPSRRASAWWLVFMVLANWTVMNSGTVKEAYILLLTMNLCGGLSLLLSAGVTNKLLKLWQAIGALLLFVLIATPIWLTFLQTLRTSWTAYDAGAVFQIQPSLLIGLFDDIFYRQFNLGELHLDPSANFLVLLSILWFLFATPATTSRDRPWGITITTLMALLFAFGVIPPSLILRVPFLNRIYHIDNTFSCVAIIGLLLLAGFGIRAFWESCGTTAFARVYGRVMIALTVLLAVYLGTSEATQRATKWVGGQIPKSPFFWTYAALLVVAVVVAPWLARRFINHRGRDRLWTVLALGVVFVLIHWRFGMYLETRFDSYVMNPHERVPLVAESSAAVNFMKSHGSDPFRAVGLRYNLPAGCGGPIGIEEIDSADPLLNRSYRQLIDSSGITLPFASSHPGLLDEKLESYLPLLDMLNVRYILSEKNSNPDLMPFLKKVQALDLDVYESGSSWPRAFFTNRVKSYGEETEFIGLLQESDGKPFAALPATELAKQADVRRFIDTTSISRPGEIVAGSNYILKTNTTSFVVKAPGPGIVVLTEPYVEEDLQLQINGRRGDYFRVNSAFRGVFVPAAGEYRFVFSYWPRHLTASLWISALGLALLGLWAGKAWKHSRGET